jgi:putative flippase GtrA
MAMATTRAGWHQIARYVAVGLASNGVLYLLYLALTSAGLPPAGAMSVSYGVAVLQTFVFNSKWSFGFTGARAPALVRYATAYALGYFINLFALVLLVDKVGLPHQLVQGVMILVVAVMLFMAQRYWVFPKAAAADMA